MKLIFTFLIIVIMPVSLGAQNHLIGIQGGLNLANASTSNFPSQGYRKGVNAGLSYEYLLKEHFSIGADLLYTQRGFTSTIPFINSNGYITAPNSRSQFNYDYVSLPIKASYRLGEKFYGFVNLGIVPSILVNATTIVDNMNTGMSDNYDQTDRVNKFDLSGIAELGAGYKIQNRYWLFGSVGYQSSFISTTTEQYFAELQMFHYGFTFSLGVKYALGK